MISEDKRICNVILSYLDHFVLHSFILTSAIVICVFRDTRKGNEEVPQHSYPRFPTMDRVKPPIRIMG